MQACNPASTKPNNINDFICIQSPVLDGDPVSLSRRFVIARSVLCDEAIVSLNSDINPSAGN